MPLDADKKPPKEAINLKDNQIDRWLWDELQPKTGRPCYRAHQFTINGITWPFILNYNFACVPEPSNIRRSDMLSALQMIKLADFIFFFEADPHPNPTITDRRGIRGVYRVTRTMYWGKDTITHEGYSIHGSCPHCGSTQSSLPRRNADAAGQVYNVICPTCRHELRQHDFGGGFLYPDIVLPWRLDVEPIILFNVPVSDERVYSDMEDPGIIWVGRHDNQSSGTGRFGKGSSIRHLAPEEAVKLVRLLRTEPGQTINAKPPGHRYEGERREIVNDDGSPATHPLIRFHRDGNHEIQIEFDLGVAMAWQFDKAASSLTAALNTAGDFSYLEYASVLYPWGYTAGQADFLICFSNPSGRYKVFIIETKKGVITDRADGNGAILQVSMYVPWVVQRIFRDLEKFPECLEVIPIAMGRRIGVRGYTTAAPKAYDDTYTFPDGKSLNVHVERTRFVRYDINDAYAIGGNWRCRAVTFVDNTEAIPVWIDWKPPHGVSTGNEATEWIRNTSWELSRQQALR